MKPNGLCVTLMRGPLNEMSDGALLLLRDESGNKGKGPYWYVHTSLPRNIRGVQYVTFHVVNEVFRNNCIRLINSTVVCLQLFKIFVKKYLSFRGEKFQQLGVNLLNNEATTTQELGHLYLET
jgi:hypothetical protein